MTGPYIQIHIQKIKIQKKIENSKIKMENILANQRCSVELQFFDEICMPASPVI